MGGEGAIGPRDNVFPGPTVALDGPAWTYTKTWYRCIIKLSKERDTKRQKTTENECSDLCALAADSDILGMSVTNEPPGWDTRTLN